MCPRTNSNIRPIVVATVIEDNTPANPCLPTRTVRTINSILEKEIATELAEYNLLFDNPRTICCVESIKISVKKYKQINHLITVVTFPKQKYRIANAITDVGKIKAIILVTILFVSFLSFLTSIKNRNAAD